MRKKILVVFFLILLIQLGLHLFLNMRADRITPPGHVHILADVHSYYAGVILQGKLGAWAHTYSYTTLPTPKIYTYLFFIGAGKIAALFHIDHVVMYEVTRIAGSIAVLAATYWLVTILFPASLRIPAMIFTMVFETGPMWTNILHTSVWQWKTSWFIPPLLDRLFYLSHHLWAEALGLMLLCMIIRTVQKPSRLSYVLISILSVAAPLTNPTFSIILVPCVFIPWLLYAAATKTLRQTFVPLVIAITGIGCVALFTLQQYAAAGQPWSTSAAVEKIWWTTGEVLIPFLQSFSLYYPFVAVLLILTPFTWRRWSPAMRLTFVLALSWSVLPVGLICLSAIPWFPLVNGRIATDLSMVPIGILSALVFYAACQTTFLRRFVRPIVIFLFILITGASIFLSVVYFNQTIQKQDLAVSEKEFDWIGYPTVDLWNGIMALKKVPCWSHVMAYPNIADILPVYLPVRVFQSTTFEGNGLKERNTMSYWFYTGELSRAELRKLLTENAISYVFVGPDELASLKTPTFYPDVLDIMYQNPEVTIYKVRTSAL